MGQDLTVVAEYFDSQWHLAEPMVPTGAMREIPDYLKKIDGYVEQFGHLLEANRGPTHEPVSLWNHRNGALQAELMRKTKHRGLPDDCSAELREYVEAYCADWIYGLGWALEPELPRSIKERLGLSRYRSLGRLRVVFWFS